MGNSSLAGNLTPNPEDSAIAFTDVTTGNASTSKHGYMPKLGNDATKFFNGQGAQTTPTGSGMTSGIQYSYKQSTVISTGTLKPGFQVPFACTITNVTVTLDQTGSIVLDIWKDTYANYPPTIADTITASAKPTISAGVKYTDSTLTGWTKTLAAGDWLLFNVDSVSDATGFTCAFTVTRT